MYDIQLEVDPPNRTVRGTQEVTYTNNSPDTLKILNYKLIINYHKPGSPRLRPASEDYLTSGIHIDTYKENGTEQKWEDESDGTNKVIVLAEPLPQEIGRNLFNTVTKLTLVTSLVLQMVTK